MIFFSHVWNAENFHNKKSQLKKDMKQNGIITMRQSTVAKYTGVSIILYFYLCIWNISQYARFKVKLSNHKINTGVERGMGLKAS